MSPPPMAMTRCAPSTQAMPVMTSSGPREPSGARRRVQEDAAEHDARRAIIERRWRRGAPAAAAACCRSCRAACRTRSTEPVNVTAPMKTPTTISTECTRVGRLGAPARGSSRCRRAPPPRPRSCAGWPPARASRSSRRARPEGRRRSRRRRWPPRAGPTPSSDAANACDRVLARRRAQRQRRDARTASTMPTMPKRVSPPRGLLRGQAAQAEDEQQAAPRGRRARWMETSDWLIIAGTS